MANLIIKSDERREQEECVRRSFCVQEHDAAGRDAAEVIAARTQEAIEKANFEGSKRSWS